MDARTAAPTPEAVAARAAEEARLGAEADAKRAADSAKANAAFEAKHDVGSLGVRALKQYIARAGLRHDDCIEKKDLVARAQEGAAAARAARAAEAKNRRKRAKKKAKKKKPARVKKLLGLLTPLHCAAAKGHTSTIRLLASKGADVDAADCNGDTPLHVAGATAREEPYSALLAAGASRGKANAAGERPELAKDMSACTIS